MYQVCRHIKTNGLRCQSPALKGSTYCYYHTLKQRAASSTCGFWDDLRFPDLEDAMDIQLSLSEVLEAIASSRIDSRRAGLILYTLQIASQNLRRVRMPAAGETVHVTTLSSDGKELAPVLTVCEPEDCLGCPQRTTCNGANLAAPPQHLAPKSLAPRT